MKNLTAKSQKTLDKLNAKADFFSIDKVRMPSIKLIAELLDELGKTFKIYGVSTRKQRSAGRMAYATSGGKRIYEGTKLVFELNGSTIELDSTCSFYSLSTDDFARDLIKFINK